MSKISIIDATVEQIISDIAYWEDIETSLRIMPTEDGGVYVESFGGDHCVRAETLVLRFTGWSCRLAGPWWTSCAPSRTSR